MRTLLLLFVAGCTVQTAQRNDADQNGRVRVSEVKRTTYRDAERRLETSQAIELVRLQFGGQSGEPGPPEDGLGNSPTNPGATPDPATPPEPPPDDHFTDADNDGIPDPIDPNIDFGEDTSDTGDTGE